MTVLRSANVVRLSATSISGRIDRLLDRTQRGAIIGVFPRSCYVDLDRHIIAVVGTELLNGPLNLVVSLPSGATLIDVPVGATVETRGRVLEIDGGWHIDATRTRLWDARLTPIVGTAELDRWLLSVQAVLDADAPRGSLARVEGRPRRAAEAMALLATGLRKGDGPAVSNAAQDLAGLGPGLTPSGDDVLAGTLLAVALLKPAHAHGCRENIMASTRGRTTRISEAYLEAAAAGEAGEAWHQLLAMLRRDERTTVADAAGEATTPSPAGGADLRAAVHRVLAFGETSGADMLAGFVLATTALLPT